MAKKQMSNEVLYAVIGLIIGIVLAIFVIGPMMTPTGQFMGGDSSAAVKALSEVQFKKALKTMGVLEDQVLLVWTEDQMMDYKHGTMKTLGAVVYLNGEYSQQLSQMMYNKLLEARSVMKSPSCAIEAVEGCMDVTGIIESRMAVLEKNPAIIEAAIENSVEALMSNYVHKNAIEMMAPLEAAAMMRMENADVRLIIESTNYIDEGKQPVKFSGIVLNSLGYPSSVLTYNYMDRIESVMESRSILAEDVMLVSPYVLEQSLKALNLAIIETNDFMYWPTSWNPASFPPVFSPSPDNPA